MSERQWTKENDQWRERELNLASSAPEHDVLTVGPSHQSRLLIALSLGLCCSGKVVPTPYISPLLNFQKVFRASSVRQARACSVRPTPGASSGHHHVLAASCMLVPQCCLRCVFAVHFSFDFFVSPFSSAEKREKFWGRATIC